MENTKVTRQTQRPHQQSALPRADYTQHHAAHDNKVMASVAATPPAKVQGVKVSIRIRKPKILRTVTWRTWRRGLSGKIARMVPKSIPRMAGRVWHYVIATRLRRVVLLATAFVLVLTTIIPMIELKLTNKVSALSSGENAVLLKTNKSMADLITYDTQTQSYSFNQKYQPFNDSSGSHAGGSYIKATIPKDPSKGITVTDPVDNVDLTVTPKFDLGSGVQDENRVVFPAFNGGGHLVYTAGSIGVKQDVTLDHYIGDTVKYKYELNLGSNYVARLTKEGSVAVYGSSLPITGNVSTGNAKDAALLAKARNKAPKDKLFFTLPVPKLAETAGHLSKATAHYELKGSELTVVTEHLKTASYPLSIDPTITAVSGSGGNGLFSFDANIETNVYVDPSNGFFERSPLTGGNLLTWNAEAGAAGTVGVPQVAHFLGSAAVYAGTLYLIGGTETASSTTNITSSTKYIEQAKIASDGSIGVFSSGNSTNLPAGGLSRFKVLTYNGYMYIIDGSTNDSTGASVSNAVYYTRITSESTSTYAQGAQLKNWSTAANAPSTALFDYGATSYNGYIYIAGGAANISGTITPQSSVQYATLLPNGNISAFSSAGASLPSNRIGLDMQAYNGHLYVIGGNINTVASPTWTAVTLYSSIAANGGIADAAWKTGANLVSTDGVNNQVLENYGAQFTMVYNGYLYVSGGYGCAIAAPATTSTCSGTAAVGSYVQLAQLNADGSVGTFFPNDFQSGGTATLQRAGTPTIGYNGTLYGVGGCSALNASPVSCSTNVVSSSYAAVNGTTTATAATGVGDISSNRNPTALPVGLYGHASVVLNGYLYIIGGCLTVSCDGTRSANYTTYYALINADGSLGAFNNNTVATSALALGFDKNSGDNNCSVTGNDYCGLAGVAAVAYNGYIYVVGGYTGNNATTVGYNNAVYYMQPTVSNGQTTTWTKSATATIANAAAGLSMVAYNGSLYDFGGCAVTTTGSKGIGCSTYYTQVQRSTLTAGVPGAFTAVTGTPPEVQLTSGIAAFGIAMSGNYVYLTGGADATNPQEKIIQRAKINAAGDVVSVITGTSTGTWTNTTAVMAYSSATATTWTARRRGVAAVVNGYLYVIAGHNAADTGGGNTNGTTYGDIEIGKIDMSTGGNGDIAGVRNTAPATPDFELTRSSSGTITPRWNPAVAFNNGTIYVTGGCTGGVSNFPPANCVTDSTVDESFTVYNANNLGINTWNGSTIPSGGGNRIGAAVTVVNGYIYMAGGCTSYVLGNALGCATLANSTEYAQIGADGTLGTWQIGPNLPAAVSYGQLVASGGAMYFMGGVSAAGISSAIYKSTIGAAGLPGAFSTLGIALPTVATTSAGTTCTTPGMTLFSAVIYAGRIYIAGGNNGGAASCGNIAAVYYSNVVAGNITSWTATSSFTTPRSELSLVSAGAYLYIIGGGNEAGTFYKDVQLATPNTSTGAISSWTTTGEIPYAEGSMSATAANGYIYVTGGRNGNAAANCTSSTYFASVNGNGTVGAWQYSPNSNATSFPARFSAGGGFYNGYIFSIAGGDCNGGFPANPAEQTGQLSEAIHATYTRYIDFGTDATFRQFYVLGTNAQISGTDIDIWNLKVKTATAANAATQGWGQTYSTALTGLTTGPAYGTPITFQALNSSGVDQGVARYWDVTFDIDQAQSFNFPDSIQPQITKYDLYFSPGPAARMRDGKTFVNEQQTNLDAHP